MTKKLKDITFDEASTICSKMAFCIGHGNNCQLYVDSLGACIFRNIHSMRSGKWGEYYDAHKNDLVTFEYDETNDDGGITW